MVSQLFIEIIKCELDFAMVAMGEPDPGHEPLPRESRYGITFSMFGDWDLENLHHNSTNTKYSKQNAVFLE